MSDYGDNGFGPVDSGGKGRSRGSGRDRGRRDDRDAVRQRAERRWLGRQQGTDALPEYREPPASAYPDQYPPAGLPPRGPEPLPGLPRRQDTGSWPALPSPSRSDLPVPYQTPAPYQTPPYQTPPAYQQQAAYDPPPAPAPPPVEEPSPDWLLPGVAIVAVVAVILAAVAVTWMFGIRP